MEIWGAGEIRRDFVYVDAVVKAIISAIDARDSSGTFNVGGGASYSLNQIVAIAQEICGRRIAVEYRSPRTIDVHDVTLDIARIRDSLHWQPETGLREGIERTWQWLRT
jgi:UDP-glucose 4-epimerase